MLWSVLIFKKNYNNVKVVLYVEIFYIINNVDVEIIYIINVFFCLEFKVRRRLDFINMMLLLCCIDDGSFVKFLL